MLVQQWAILQTPKPQAISNQKTIALVNSLAKQHNFCIDKKELNMLELPTDDNFRIVNNEMGFVPLEEPTNCDVPIPVQILDGGNHFNDLPQTKRRHNNRQDAQQDETILPRESLRQLVIDAHMVRPSTNIYKQLLSFRCKNV
jgi:hypothetical protein